MDIGKLIIIVASLTVIGCKAHTQSQFNAHRTIENRTIAHDEYAQCRQALFKKHLPALYIVNKYGFKNSTLADKMRTEQLSLDEKAMALDYWKDDSECTSIGKKAFASVSRYELLAFSAAKAAQERLRIQLVQDKISTGEYILEMELVVSNYESEMLSILTSESNMLGEAHRDEMLKRERAMKGIQEEVNDLNNSIRENTPKTPALTDCYVTGNSVRCISN